MADLSILDKLRFVASQQNQKKRSASSLVSFSQDSCCSSTQPLNEPRQLSRQISEATTQVTCSRPPRRLSIAKQSIVSIVRESCKIRSTQTDVLESDNPPVSCDWSPYRAILDELRTLASSFEELKATSSHRPVVMGLEDRSIEMEVDVQDSIEELQDTQLIHPASRESPSLPPWELEDMIITSSGVRNSPGLEPVQVVEEPIPIFESNRTTSSAVRVELPKVSELYDCSIIELQTSEDGARLSKPIAVNAWPADVRSTGPLTTPWIRTGTRAQDLSPVRTYESTIKLADIVPNIPRPKPPVQKEKAKPKPKQTKVVKEGTPRRSIRLAQIVEPVVSQALNETCREEPVREAPITRKGNDEPKLSSITGLEQMTASNPPHEVNGIPNQVEEVNLAPTSLLRRIKKAVQSSSL